MTFEQKLENNRKKVERNNELLKEEKQKLEKDLEALVQVIREITIELELIENYGKYFNEDEISKPVLSKKNSRKTIYENNEQKNLIRLNRRKAENKRFENLIYKKKSLEQLLSKKEAVVKKIDELHLKIKENKNDLRQIIDQLNIHYHKLLKRGKDTRVEGLRWIIRSIWSLKSVVMTSYLPDFLDDKSITYLFEVIYHVKKVTKKDVEILKIREKVYQIKKKLAQLKTNSSQNSNKNRNIRDNYSGSVHLPDLNTFSSESVSQNDHLKSKLLFKSSSLGRLLNNSSSTMIGLDNEKIYSFREINKYLDENRKPIKVDEYSVIYLKEIKTLEEKEAKILNDIEDKKTKELKRINNEFLLNDYERRFNVKEEEVISALIGEDLTASWYNKLLREQRVNSIIKKEVLKKTNSCRTFNFIEKKSPSRRNLTHIKLDME